MYQTPTASDRFGASLSLKPIQIGELGNVTGSSSTFAADQYIDTSRNDRTKYGVVVLLSLFGLGS
ncbi:hypothetical protein CHELA17_50160 [Chelatococcus asaccharovorans]|nr:hypothetical protein CHELA17_50160 [Chelatococcus asaccharovorans]